MPKDGWEDGAAPDGDEESLSARLDPDLETETELDAILGPDPKKGADDGSEQPESEATPAVKTEVKELYELVQANARVQALEAKVQELLQQKKAAEEEQEEEVEFDAGDLPEDYTAKDFKPILDRAGTVLAKEIAKARRELKQEVKAAREELAAKIRDEVIAARVRQTHGITTDQENKITAWAEKMGFRYETEAQLSEVIKTYKKVHSEEEDGQATRTAARPSPAPRVRPTAQSAAGKSKPARPRTFDESMKDAFNRARRQTLNDLKAGKLRTY